MIFYILEEVNDSNFSKGTVIPHKKNIEILPLGYSRKKSKRGGALRTLFFSDKMFYPLKLHKTVLHPSEILRPQPRPLKISPFFLDHLLRFHVVFNQPLENPLAISSITLEIAYPQPPHVLPVCFFPST